MNYTFPKYTCFSVFLGFFSGIAKERVVYMYSLCYVEILVYFLFFQVKA